MDRDFPFLFYRFHYDENTAFSYYHYHNYIEITLVWNGAIEYSFEDGTKVRAGAGDIVLVNNVEPHSVRGTKERASIAVLGFLPDLVWNGASDTDFSYIESFFNSGEVFENHIPASRAYSDEIVSLIRQIGVERDRKEDGYKMMIKTKLMQILTILYRYHPKKKTVGEPKISREDAARFAVYPRELYAPSVALRMRRILFVQSRLFFQTFSRSVGHAVFRLPLPRAGRNERETLAGEHAVGERSVRAQRISGFFRLFRGVQKAYGRHAAAISQTIDKRFVRGYNLTEERFL